MTDQQPGVVTLPDYVRSWAKQTPTKVALVDPRRTVTYRELDSTATAVALALQERGAAPGDTVGYLGENSAAFFEIWMGANRAGCIFVPFNWRSSRHELAGLMEDARPVIVFVGSGFRELADRTVESLARPPLILNVDDIETWLPDDCATTDSERAAEPGATALLAYTSGTTGAPKGVPISHTALIEWFAAAADEPAASWCSADVGLMVMPNFHLAGSWVSIPALLAGATLVVLPGFEPELCLRTIRTHGVTVTCLVPTAIRTLLQHLPRDRGELASLRRLMYAGSPIGSDTLAALIDNLDCDLVQFYGTTETFIISLLRPDQHRASGGAALASCGQPMPAVAVRLVDRDGREVPVGETGEVLVRSPWMFDGYWNKPEATAEVLTDGWYHTGDVGFRDEADNLHLVDRLKDMIVTGGENVYSVEVERALSSHPGVVSAAVVGAPDEKWGQRVVGFVVLEAGVALGPTDLSAHCRQQIAGYKVPKEIHLVESLPVTASGKVQKAALRAQLDRGTT